MMSVMNFYSCMIGRSLCYTPWLLRMLIGLNAMKSELEVIERSKIWNLVKLPQGRKPNGLKWFYKLKKGSKRKSTEAQGEVSSKGLCSETRDRL